MWEKYYTIFMQYGKMANDERYNTLCKFSKIQANITKRKKFKNSAKKSTLFKEHLGYTYNIKVSWFGDMRKNLHDFDAIWEEAEWKKLPQTGTVFSQIGEEAIPKQKKDKWFCVKNKFFHIQWVTW